MHYFTAIYYSDLERLEGVFLKARKQMEAAIGGNGVIVNSCRHPMFKKTLVVDKSAPRGHPSIYMQIIAGVEAADTEIVFMMEHDVLYHPTHFTRLIPFIMEDRARPHFQSNVWHLSKKGFWKSGHNCYLSCMAGTKDTILAAVRKKLEDWKVGQLNSAEPDGGVFHDLEIPTIDVRHGGNLTGMREHPEYLESHPVWGHKDLWI